VTGRRTIDLISTLPVAIPASSRRRLSVGLDRHPGGLYGTIWILRWRHRAFHARHGEVAVDLVPADPPRTRGGRLGLRQRTLATIGTIVLPLARPGVIASMTLLFVLSIGSSAHRCFSTPATPW